MSTDISNYTNRHAMKDRVGRIVWGVVWALLCRWTPPGLGVFYRWRNLWLRAFGAKIGQGCHIYPGAKVWQPWRLEMGENSCLANGADCYSADQIRIGKNVVISQDAFLCAAGHDLASPTFELVTKPIVIGDFAWVAAKALVLPGVTVGEGAVVAAGAVVTKDVTPWTVVGGNPAREVKRRVVSG